MRGSYSFWVNDKNFEGMLEGLKICPASCNVGPKIMWGGGKIWRAVRPPASPRFQHPCNFEVSRLNCTL